MALVRARLCKLQKGCTRLAAASDKAYQLLDHGRHDIAEILLKETLKYLIVCISMTVNCYDNSKYECNKLFAKFFLDSAFYTAHVTQFMTSLH